MKILKTLLLAFFITHSLQGYSQLENKKGTVYLNKQILFKIVKTKGLNYLTTEMPHYSLYDKDNIERIRFANSKLTFSDSKAFINTDDLLDPNERAISNFFGNDSLFTLNGYNKNYEAYFIKNHNGFLEKDLLFERDALGNVVRDKSKPISINQDLILQDNKIIGKFFYTSKDNNVTYQYGNIDKKMIAKATFYYDLLNSPGKDININLETENETEKIKYDGRITNLKTWIAENLVKKALL